MIWFCINKDIPMYQTRGSNSNQKSFLTSFSGKSKQIFFYFLGAQFYVKCKKKWGCVWFEDQKQDFLVFEEFLPWTYHRALNGYFSIFFRFVTAQKCHTCYQFYNSFCCFCDQSFLFPFRRKNCRATTPLVSKIKISKNDVVAKLVLVILILFTFPIVYQ